MPRGRKFKVLLGSSMCLDCSTILEHHNCVWNGRFLRNRCKECFKNYVSIRDEKWRNSEKGQKTIRNNNYKIKFGISLEDYNILLNKQGNICAICREECKSGKQLAVDHDHNTGQIRGLLCISCNNALGALKENEDIIWNILEYLKKYKWKVAS